MKTADATRLLLLFSRQGAAAPPETSALIADDPGDEPQPWTKGMLMLTGQQCECHGGPDVDFARALKGQGQGPGFGAFRSRGRRVFLTLAGLAPDWASIDEVFLWYKWKCKGGCHEIAVCRETRPAPTDPEKNTHFHIYLWAENGFDTTDWAYFAMAKGADRRFAFVQQLGVGEARRQRAVAYVRKGGHVLEQLQGDGSEAGAAVPPALRSHQLLRDMAGAAGVGAEPGVVATTAATAKRKRKAQSLLLPPADDEWTGGEKVAFVMGMRKHGCDMARIARVVGRSFEDTCRYAERFFPKELLAQQGLTTAAAATAVSGSMRAPAQQHGVSQHGVSQHEGVGTGAEPWLAPPQRRVPLGSRCFQAVVPPVTSVSSTAAFSDTAAGCNSEDYALERERIDRKPLSVPQLGELCFGAGGQPENWESRQGTLREQAIAGLRKHNRTDFSPPPSLAASTLPSNSATRLSISDTFSAYSANHPRQQQPGGGMRGSSMGGGGMGLPPLYTCEGGCGITGSYAAMLEHESTCNRAAAKLASAASRAKKGPAQQQLPIVIPNKRVRIAPGLCPPTRARHLHPRSFLAHECV